MNIQLANYQLLEGIPSNTGELQYILDTVNQKYNNSTWRFFTDVLPASRSKRFSAIIEETGIAVQASLLGAEGKKPLRSIEGGELYSDSIHKIGHGFAMSQTDINAIDEMNLLNVDYGEQMVEKYMNRAGSLIGGFHSTWNGWIFQALADQTIVLKPQGAASGLTVDLRTPASHKLKAKGTQAWFNVDADTFNILADLKRMNKIGDDKGLPSDRLYVCSKDLFDKMIADASLVGAIKARMPIQNSTNAVLSDGEILMGLRALGLPPIVAIDEKSRTEVDGVPTADAAKFDTNKISLIPATKLFNLHNSPSDYAMDNNPATLKAFFEGGLIGAIELFESDPIKVITNMESWSFLSFKNPKWIVSLDSSLHSTTGA